MVFKNSVAFSLSLDESTEIQHNPQLAEFIRYVSSDVTVKGAPLDLVAFKESIHGVDIKSTLDRNLKNADALLNKRFSVATHGAPAMVGKMYFNRYLKESLVKMLKTTVNIVRLFHKVKSGSFVAIPPVIICPYLH
ncbi:Hypothetical predicted protein [Octopus vulgaris]|uniref:Uncharacterized protein n=1 Tax=Octopus vulgaris TaxID=6645 RepID=A0AA36AWR0_OCTVU|nr:Hypothetical predicted protein [Octopus vulgaris]